MIVQVYPTNLKYLKSDLKYLLNINKDYINYICKQINKSNQIIITNDNVYLYDTYIGSENMIFYINTSKLHSIIEILKTCNDKTLIIELNGDEIQEYKKLNNCIFRSEYSTDTYSEKIYIINNYMVTDLEFRFFFCKFSTIDFKTYLRNFKIKKLV